MNPKRAVITGASSGIGESFARQLAAKKVNLVLVARRKERLEALASELGRLHQVEVECVSLDLSVPGAPKQLFEAVTQGGKSVDFLINNAGVGPYSYFLNQTWEKHQSVIQLNLVSLSELCHLFATHMLSHRNPSFIANVASIAAYQGVPRFAVYAASKSFVRIFSTILNQELKGTNVSVTCVCPGGTATEFLEKNNQTLKGASGARFLMSAESVAAISLKGIFARRPVVIPGFMNKLACFLPRFFSESFSMRIAVAAMANAVEESPPINK